MGDAPRIINTKPQNVALAKLREHPANPREGDVGAVSESIAQNGFYGFVVAQKSSGYVLAGNHRLKAARALEMDAIPTVYVDVGDEAAMRILLADNRTSDLASYNNAALADLLEHLATTDAWLTGTGYSDESLQEILYELGQASPHFEPVGFDEQGRLDEKTMHLCPECGHSFQP